MNVEDIGLAIKESWRRKESIILGQLNELLSRGLLVIEEDQPMLVRLADQDAVEMRQHVRLVLKDMEYIKQLEHENAELRAQVEGIRKILDATFGEEEADQ